MKINRFVEEHKVVVGDGASIRLSEEEFQALKTWAKQLGHLSPNNLTFASLHKAIREIPDAPTDAL